MVNVMREKILFMATSKVMLGTHLLEMYISLPSGGTFKFVKDA